MRTAMSETWEEYRSRMLRETGRFIEWGLRHPEMVIEIPSKPAGENGFPVKVAQWFWGVVLTERTDSFIERWREILRRRPKGLFIIRRKAKG
jgi:hypothetical protein